MKNIDCPICSYDNPGSHIEEGQKDGGFARCQRCNAVIPQVFEPAEVPVETPVETEVPTDQPSNVTDAEPSEPVVETTEENHEVVQEPPHEEATQVDA